MVNKLIQVGMQHIGDEAHSNGVEEHCQLLIMQISALVKGMAVECLKYKEEDFARLKEAAVNKLNSLKTQIT